MFESPAEFSRVKMNKEGTKMTSAARQFPYSPAYRLEKSEMKSTSKAGRWKMKLSLDSISSTRILNFFFFSYILDEIEIQIVDRLRIFMHFCIFVKTTKQRWVSNLYDRILQEISYSGILKLLCVCVLSWAQSKI